MSKSTKMVTRLSLLTALALILTLVENMLPPLFAFAPGTKLGLANACILAALVLFGPAEASIVLAERCVLAALFAGNPFSLMYAVPAGLVSFSVQYVLYRFLFPHIGLVSISLVGAIAHNITQLAVASIVVQANLWYLFPLMLVASALAGLFIGCAVYWVITYLPKQLMGS